METCRSVVNLAILAISPVAHWGSSETPRAVYQAPDQQCRLEHLGWKTGHHYLQHLGWANDLVACFLEGFCLVAAQALWRCRAQASWPAAQNLGCPSDRNPLLQVLVD